MELPLAERYEIEYLLYNFEFVELIKLNSVITALFLHVIYTHYDMLYFVSGQRWHCVCGTTPAEQKPRVARNAEAFEIVYRAAKFENGGPHWHWIHDSGRGGDSKVFPLWSTHATFEHDGIELLDLNIQKSESINSNNTNEDLTSEDDSGFDLRNLIDESAGLVEGISESIGFNSDNDNIYNGLYEGFFVSLLQFGQHIIYGECLHNTCVAWSKRS